MRNGLVIVMVFWLSGCQFGEKQQQSNPIVADDPIPAYVDYRVEKIDKKVGACENDSTAKQCLFFQIEYPVITGKVGPEVMDKINAAIEKEILLNTPVENGAIATVEGMMDELSSSYQQLVNEFEDYEQSWLVEINADILYQNQNYISIASSVFNFTGGAHPNNSQIYKTYDLQTGEPITLGDLFIEGYEKALYEAAEIEFRMQKEIPPRNSLSSAGYWFEDDQFKLNENFAIIRQSLIFYFNPYEIGPYSLGATELELKLTDYIDLIKKDGLLFALLSDSTGSE